MNSRSPLLLHAAIIWVLLLDWAFSKNFYRYFGIRYQTENTSVLVKHYALSIIKCTYSEQLVKILLITHPLLTSLPDPPIAVRISINPFLRIEVFPYQILLKSLQRLSLDIVTDILVWIIKQIFSKPYQRVKKSTINIKQD